MPKKVIPLNDALIKSLKPKNTSYTKSDGDGLRINVKPNGSKLWELEYTSPVLKKRRKTSFGTYPITTLKNARELRNNWLEKIRIGIDPLEEKEEAMKQVAEINEKKSNTFEKIALDWLKEYRDSVSENYANKLEKAFYNYIFPYIAKKPILEVTRKDIIKILKDLKDRGVLETANRTFIQINKVYMYAVTIEAVPHNIMADIDKRTLLGKKPSKNYPTLTKHEDIKALLLAIDNYTGDYSTKMALKILPYLFVRSSNIRHMQWCEIDFKNKEWIIPPEKMKTKEEFILPLPKQVIKLLKEVNMFSGDGKYVFPSYRYKERAMSDNTLIGALRRLGYTSDEFVPHSFRSVFATVAYEHMNLENGHDYSAEVIEALLAHRETNKVKSAYNRSKYKEPMKGLIQWYADWLDNL